VASLRRAFCTVLRDMHSRGPVHRYTLRRRLTIGSLGGAIMYGIRIDVAKAVFLLTSAPAWPPDRSVGPTPWPKGPSSL
jgi:hypothetical protein